MTRRDDRRKARMPRAIAAFALSALLLSAAPALAVNGSAIGTAVDHAAAEIVAPASGSWSGPVVHSGSWSGPMVSSGSWSAPTVSSGSWSGPAVNSGSWSAPALASGSWS